MSRIKFKTLSAALVIIAAVALCFALAACTPQDSGSTSGADPSAAANATADSSDSATVSEAGAFVSDEQCLSCHGKSYEALAETTAGYGDWNPHDPIHGGYNSCVNCHAKDKELTDNYCTHCHAWNPSKDASS